MSTPNRMLRLAVSLGSVASIVAVCIAIRHVHTPTTVLALLFAILIIANRWGFVEAAAATGLGALLLDYFFLPPQGWGIESAEHWLDFLAFLTIALVTSHVAARERRLAEEAAARHRELEKLYAFGRDLPIRDDPGSAVAKSLDSLVRTFQVEAAAFHDEKTGEITRSGPKGGAISADLLRHAVSRANVPADKNTGSLMVPIHCAGQLIGSLAVHGDMSAPTLRAIADRIEVGLEKTYTHEKSRQAEEARKNQELKTALLDSLVHEIKTPLSVIKTAVSSLMSRDSDAAIRRELLTIANQEADRMDASISEIFWRERVEANTLQSGKGPHDIRPLVNDILSELKPLLGNRPVRFKAPDPLPPANCDIQMIKGVLKELLTNALKYSPSHSPLTISMQQIGDEIITSVLDSGIGLEPGDEKRIFERYYRGAARAAGTGLGLAVAKTIVEAHGGRIGVESQRGTGSVFHFSLPVSHQDAA